MSAKIAVGDKVRVVTLPPYLKTADPMPMLRPPDLLQVGEEGVVIDRKPGEYWSVRFSRGTFLLESQYLQTIPASEVSDSPGHTAQ